MSYYADLSGVGLRVFASHGNAGKKRHQVKKNTLKDSLPRFGTCHSQKKAKREKEKKLTFEFFHLSFFSLFSRPHAVIAMPPKKRSVDDNAKQGAKKKGASDFISVATVDDCGGFSIYKIPVNRLGQEALQELITDAACHEEMDVLCESAATSLKRLAIRIDEYEYVEGSGDDECLAKVSSDLKDCIVRRQDTEDPGTALLMNPVFSLTFATWS